MEKFRIENLDLYYGDFKALKNVNLSIPAGNITAFIGPSGCGKSTLLKSLNRMNDLIQGCRIEGKITLDGEECTIRKEPVFKPLTGKDFDSQNAVGLTIEGKDGRWTVSYANAEEPYDGSLSRCGDAEAYAKVFVKHDGEAVEVLKY